MTVPRPPGLVTAGFISWGIVLALCSQGCAEPAGPKADGRRETLAADARETVIMVPPFADLVVVDLELSSPGSPVEVLQPNGEALSAPIQWSGQRSTLVLRRPEAGAWRCRGAIETVTFRDIRFWIRGRFLDPCVARGSSDSPLRLTYELLGSEGRPLAKQATEVQLRAEAELALQSGDRLILRLEPDGAAEGARLTSEWASRGLLRGRHRLAIRVLAADSAGQWVEVLRDTTSFLGCLEPL